MLGLGDCICVAIFLAWVGGHKKQKRGEERNGRAEALVFDVRGQVRGLMLSLSRSWTL